jgi:amicyanin
MLLATAMIAVSTSASDDPKSAAVEVKIDNFTFAPAELHVKAGTDVTWVNKDDIPHNVISEDKSFKSKVMDTDERFTFTASKPGTYAYFCGIHPHMKGKLVVE